MLLRYFFSVQIPDSYDFGRLLLGILIFWGIAATSYRGTHITVDLLYANVGRSCQRVIDVFATLVLLFVVTVQTYTLFDKVRGTYADNVSTFDLRLPVWPFFLVAWIGDVVRGAADRRAHLPADLPSGAARRANTRSSRSSEAMPHLSTDAVAILGFVALFALMLLRVPVGMAMGLVGVSGFGYIVGGTPALKMVGQTSMRTVTDYTFGVIPMFLLMGAFVSNSGMSRELFRAANALRRPFASGGLGIATIAACAGFAAISRLVGRDRRDLLHRRLSGNAALQLPAIVCHRRHRRRRHARRHAAAVDRARGLRHHHRAGHRQAVHRRHHSRPARRRDGHAHGRDHRLGAAELPARRRRATPGRERLAGLRDIWATLLLFVFVIGGLYGGLFTPTEAGGVGAAGALPDRRRARQADTAGNPPLAAAGGAHRRRGAHRADRRAACSAISSP